MDNLANTLRALAKKPVNLAQVADALEKCASQGEDLDEPINYKDLIEKYHQSQIASKKTISKSSSSSSINKATPSGIHRGTSSHHYFSLNFAKYRQQLKGLKKTTTNVQVVGFTDADTHGEVLAKGAKGLGVKCDVKLLALVCSSGIVPDAEICGHPWTLGEYIHLHGGTQNRSKKTWGVLVPIDDEEPIYDKEYTSTADSGVSKTERKRASSMWSLASAKKPKKVHSGALGTSKDLPLILSNGSESGPIEVKAEDLKVTYCPINLGYVCTSVLAHGLMGVWRLVNVEYSKRDRDILSDFVLESEMFQPELHGYFLIELSHGVDTLFSVDIPRTGAGESIIHKGKLDFTTNVTILTRTSKCQVLDSSTPYGKLLVLSPNHGKDVSYKWERRNAESAMWEPIQVPIYTCLLFVDDPGDYRCMVCEEIYYFIVLWKGNKNAESKGDELCVDMKELEFGSVIGRGSFAVVYRGCWQGKDVALKQIRVPCGNITTVPKEVSILRKLSHPNIVSLLAYAVSDDDIVLVTNYVPGSNLEKLLFGKKSQQFTDKQALYIAMKIADAVHYMHSQDPIVIHQDLKPQNVLVTTDLQGVYVCDMGIAKVKQVSEATVTSVSKGPGTYPYMAPEMFKKSHRELFGRRRVWPNLDAPDIMMRVMGSYDTPPQMPDTSDIKEPYNEICHKLCRLEADKRPKSGDVVMMLKRITFNED